MDAVKEISSSKQTLKTDEDKLASSPGIFKQTNLRAPTAPNLEFNKTGNLHMKEIRKLRLGALEKLKEASPLLAIHHDQRAVSNLSKYRM